MLVDLRSKVLKSNVVVESLEAARITTNKNGVPFDTEKPTVTSGVRLGSPAGTTRGLGVAEFRQIGNLIADVMAGLVKKTNDNTDTERAVAEKVVAQIGRASWRGRMCRYG